MKSSIFKRWDWTKFDINDPAHRVMLTKQLKYFLAIPDKFPNALYAHVKAFQADRAEYQKVAEALKLRAFTTAADFPASILPLIEKFQQTTFYDDGWESIFDVKDLASQRRNGFAMLDVASGIAFAKTQTGEKAKVYQLQGEKSFIWFDRYSGGLNWDRTLFDDEEYVTIEDNAIFYRNAAFQSRAAVYYALIEAVGVAQNIAWQPPTPAALAVTDRGYNAVRDANTLNAAALNIINNTLNRGYGVTPGNTTFIVLAPMQLQGRLKQALSVGLDVGSTAEKHINYNFQVIITPMLSGAGFATQYYVILPKQKMKVGLRMDLTTFADFDILSYVDTQVGWMRHGGAIGDQQQVQRCAIA